MKTLKRFLRDQSGATSIEYAMIAAGIAVVIIVAVNNLGSALNGKYEMIRTSVQ
ncbi:conserved domain protein [Afipia carboxidovorans OM5]|uniref:Flp/Fap family protein n=1 Tax=Afipia carboxidovorans (strain ATCC 49405 / DSM 1227 / KCTC 32145 / OM5) TaxID=504832 RepID=B6JBL7_AFIC5|nr:Flp family type IVb pilin [Afipia carboxidovorans]ACI92558.1 conserved domain protein [Afipia carboxidovorans OM5]AEI03673.1 Flp/Fap family protein [Afipia carboxidovorans OM4]AEI07250.1 Flp/Fap family protein [Afipia carboxidovorans OM5]BEV44630.1 Flp family type IVb pilin [Afipia carboxidovorans]